MLRAITLIELLITLSILAFAFSFATPRFFTIQPIILLNNEIDHLSAFIYQIQTQAMYKKQNYIVTASKNNLNNQWCILAVAKNSKNLTTCDCLNNLSCTLNADTFSYYPKSNKVLLSSNNLYPKTFLNIDGKTGQRKESCLKLSMGNAEAILQFDSTGGINVAQKSKRSDCR